MLKNRQLVFHIKRYAMSNVFTSVPENMDLIDNLNTLEIKLYWLLKQSVMLNPDIDYFESANLANLLGCSVGSINNAKSVLKKKGYAIISKFKDENGNPMLRVVVGKDQVELYNLGVMVEITDAKAYKELLNMFPITNPTLTDIQRKEMVAKLNTYYKQHN